MFRVLPVAALVVAFAATSYGQGLTCSSDNTRVETPYIYDSTGKHADCPALIGSFVDWYNADFRQSCGRWMGGGDPERVESAYVTECHSYGNGTLRYRADVCCTGALTSQRCFKCNEADDHYSCNYHGTVETCATGEVCHTTFSFSGSGGNYCTRKINKGCLGRAACEAREAEDATRCMNYVDNPQCAYCYSENLGNFLTPSENTGKFCGSSSTTICTGVYCGNGQCVQDTEDTRGYRCECYNYGILVNGVCSKTVCDLDNCQNGGACSFLTSAPYYSCCCPVGFFGVNCEMSYPACNPNVCMNGGACYNQGTNGFRCVCPEGYVGTTCEKKADVKCTAVNGEYTSTYNALAMHDKTCSTWKPYEPSFLTACIWKMKRLDGPAFENGVHGTVTSLEYLGLDSCAYGDKCAWLKVKACCPSCLSAPCLNGGWCLQKSDHDFVCKCRFGYEGKFCQHKVAVCVTSGDPHYYTFDGQTLHFQGACKYSLSVPALQYANLPYFEVLTKNERRGSPHASYPSYLEVKVFGRTVRLGKGNVVTVDGKMVDLDAKYPGFTLSFNGRFARLETNFSLVVEFDGDWIGIVKLPGEYKGLMGGICANFDDDPANDLVTKDGTDVTGEPDAFNQICNSWQVDDPDTFVECPKQVGPDPNCTAEAKAEAKKVAYCGHIINVNGPFKNCILAERALADKYMFNCEYDVCATWEGNPKETACKSLEAFVAQCSSKGYPPESNWRATAVCPPDCPTGMTYAAVTSACHNTCENPRADQECSRPDSEGCKCPDGMLRLGNRCVSPNECGCKDDDGVRHVLNSQWLSADCTTKFTCSPCTSCDVVVGEITNTTNQCLLGYSCSENDAGEPACMPPPYTTPPPVHGGWSVWGPYTTCTMKFNRGEKKRTRMCNNPSPDNGGLDCVGPAMETVVCEEDCATFQANLDCQRCDLTRNPAGYLGDSCSCKHYWQCYRYNGMWRAHRRDCSACTCWDQDKLTCVKDNDAEDVECPTVYSENLLVLNEDSCIIDGKRFHRVLGDPTRYRETVDTQEFVRPCAPGTGFNVNECKCIFGDVVAQASKKVFCLTFDDGFSTEGGVWVEPYDVERVAGGVSGYAAQFNGVESRIEIPFFTNNEFAEFSFSLWFKRLNNLNTGLQGLVYNGDCEEEGSIQIRSDDLHKAGSGILTTTGDDVRNHPNLKDKMAALNSWHHVVLTYNGTMVKFYVNNAEVGSAAASGPTERNHCPLVLGLYFNNGFFEGLMDEVCFYNEALTVEEVTKLYNLEDVV